MKISELVTKLEELKAEHGDLEVTYHDNYEGGSCPIDRIIPNYPFKAGTVWDEDMTQPAYQIELI